jgi:hypothetical protein
MKVHKAVIELTLIEDDVDLVIEKVHDYTIEAWYDAKKQRE